MAGELPNTNEGSRVRLLSSRAEGEVRAEARPSNASNPAFLQQMIASLTAIAMLLSARFLLLLSGIGAFALHFMAVQNPDTMRLLTAAGYDFLVFIPLTYLYVTRG